MPQGLGHPRAQRHPATNLPSYKRFASIRPAAMAVGVSSGLACMVIVLQYYTAGNLRAYMTSPSANTLGFVVASEQPGGGGVGEGGKMCPEAEADTPASERFRPLVKGYLMRAE